MDWLRVYTNTVHSQVMWLIAPAIRHILSPVYKLNEQWTTEFINLALTIQIHIRLIAIT